MERIGWRLVLEPTMTGLVWSLIRATGSAGGAGTQGGGGADDFSVWAGRHVGPEGCERLAATIVPEAGADIWDSPLADPDAELDIARSLGRSLLPEPLRHALAGPGTAQHTLTVAVRGWCAAVPWEALVIDDCDTRLVERCRVLGEAHAAAGVDRGPTGDAEVERTPPDQGGLTVVDPGPVAAEDPAMAPLYPAGLPPELARSALGEDVVLPGPEGLSVAALGEILRAGTWERFLYAGHVRPGSTARPGDAALVLADGLDADLLTVHAWLARPDLWPLPRRVALIGCASGDGRPLEGVGLPLAALRAGAEIVTATRWPLPSDLSEREPGFTHLVRAVHAAHLADDPVGHLRSWQITELHRWRTSGYAVHAPLTWAALVTASTSRQGRAKV
jgi:hypothetical protein